LDLRVAILGHFSAKSSLRSFDRILAIKLGVAATQFLVEGQFRVLAGLISSEIKATTLAEGTTTKK